jgi:hypothetical protein
VIEVLDFAGRSMLLSLLLAFCLVGFSCFQHGDVGPYPEVDFMWAVIPVAMLLAFVWMKNARD